MKAPALLAVLWLLAACTQLQRETSAREHAQSECARIRDVAERTACMRRAEYDWGTTGALEQRSPPPR